MVTDLEKLIALENNEPEYQVEVHCEKPEFPFKLFKKKPYDDSRNYSTPDRDSFAEFGFKTEKGSKAFAEKARKKKGLSARVFRLDKISISFNYVLV